MSGLVGVWEANATVRLYTNKNWYAQIYRGQRVQVFKEDDLHGAILISRKPGHKYWIESDGFISVISNFTQKDNKRVRHGPDFVVWILLGVVLFIGAFFIGVDCWNRQDPGCAPASGVKP